MLSKKIFLSAAFISMAGFVACGDDSSSNSGDDSNDIPEKVETIDKAIHLNCTEEIKCTMVYVEEVKDNFFCNGTKFEPYSPVLNAKDCPAEEEKGEEGTEEGSEEGSEEGGNGSDNNGNKSEGDQGSANTGDNGTSTDEGTSASSAESTSSNADSADSGEGSEGGEELTGPTGDVVSCLQEINMMGVTTQSCSEMAASSEDVAAMQAACQSVEGFVTATLGTGCPASYTKKCIVDNENVAYFYEEANANEDCADLVQKN